MITGTFRLCVILSSSDGDSNVDINALELNDDNIDDKVLAGLS